VSESVAAAPDPVPDPTAAGSPRIGGNEERGPPAPDPMPLPPATGDVPGVTGRRQLQCTFTGKAGDYFRIWIVNLLLTLVSLGLWSPWATVRKRRFFYGHTWLADANFEFHGNPVAILRGRLIAAAAVAVYWFVENLVPDSAAWLVAALLCGAPWIVARSLAFNAANSSHRGIRFRFLGTPRDVALAIWPLALLLIAFVAASHSALDALERPGRLAGQFGGMYLLLLGAYPYAIARIRRLTVGKAAWGDQPFSSGVTAGKVYGIYGIGIVLCGIPLVATILVGFLATTFIGMALGGSPAVFLLAVPFLVLGWVGIVIVWTAYNRSRMTNLVLGTARLSSVARLHSAISGRKLARLYAGNLIAIVVTCGLLIPWAVVRITRYRLQALSVEIEAPLATVAAAVVQVPRATGEELGEMFGFDLAL
jgi:uncharacterized membrane protein YjgN (DUF898 family)